MFEEPADLFRQYLWVPDHNLSESECLEFAKILGESNKAIARFLNGEVTDDEFLDLVRSPYLFSIDDYIQTVEANLDAVERGKLIL
ncbi:MAG: hypothetical protein AAFO04_30170 [Cyanobacteria bacterium J06592_8]